MAVAATAAASTRRRSVAACLLRRRVWWSSRPSCTMWTSWCGRPCCTTAWWLPTRLPRCSSTPRNSPTPGGEGSLPRLARTTRSTRRATLLLAWCCRDTWRAARARQSPRPWPLSVSPPAPATRQVPAPPATVSMPVPPPSMGSRRHVRRCGGWLGRGWTVAWTRGGCRCRLPCTAFRRRMDRRSTSPNPAPPPCRHLGYQAELTGGAASTSWRWWRR